MKRKHVATSCWPGRLKRLAVVGSLMSVSFVLGIALTTIVAARLVLPLAVVGMTMGLQSLVSATSTATLLELHSGDSKTRLTILQGLKDSFDSQSGLAFDTASSEYILSALQQCQTDPEVVQLAEELIGFVGENTIENVPPNKS